MLHILIIIIIIIMILVGKFIAVLDITGKPLFFNAFLVLQFRFDVSFELDDCREN